MENPASESRRVNPPEHLIPGRVRLAFRWIPAGTGSILDAGCARGYGTSMYSRKSRRTIGADRNRSYIAEARSRYPLLPFVLCRLEETPFEQDSFDTIVLCDVLEHTGEEVAVLDEMCRVLAPGGSLIITVPHRGFFSFLDAENYGYLLSRCAPSLYARISRDEGGDGGRGEKAGRYLKPRHRHYRLEDVRVLLNKSRFGGRYRVASILRSGLVSQPLSGNIDLLMRRISGKEPGPTSRKALAALSALDALIPFGACSYNLALRVEKR